MKKQYWIAIVIIIIVVSILLYRKQLKAMLDDSIDAFVNYAFSSQLENHLAQIHPKYQNRFRNFFREVKTVLGWNVIPTSTYRTFEEQANQYAVNHNNARPGYSKHNYGLAMDVNLQKGTKYLRKSSPSQEWIDTGIVELAKKYGLRWGGEFSGYADRVHFDVDGIDTSALRQLAIQQFGNDNTKIIGNRVNF